MPGKERSKEHTWSEKELEKYVKGKKSRSSRDEPSKEKEHVSSSKKPPAEHQSSSTKRHSSSKGAEASAQKPSDSTRDSKSKKVSSSSGSGYKTDERDRHRSKETDRDKRSDHHKKDKKPDESSASRHGSSKPSKVESTKATHSTSKSSPSRTANQSKERKPDKTSSGRSKERSSSKGGREGDKSKGVVKQKIKVSENPPLKTVASSSTSVASEDLELPMAVQPMIEVTRDDHEIAEEFNYDQEEFDEYEDEEFDSSSSSSDDTEHTKPLPSVPTESDRLDLMQVLQAIEAENQQLVVPEVPASPTLHQRPPPGEDYSEESPTHKNDESSATPSKKLHTSRSLVNFVAAKRQAISRKAAVKTKKRGEELLRLIELDVVVFNMLDIPPLSEYELYMKNFGSEDTRQVSSQTGEDSTGRDVQTDDIVMVNRWVQWPPEDCRGWGCDDDDDDDVMNSEHITNTILSDKDAMGLSKFLHSASQVICVLLEENSQQHNVKDYQSNITEQLSFSVGCARVPSTQSFLAGRHINSLNFSHSHGNLLLTGFSSHPKTKAQPDGGLQYKGIVCVWNTGDLSQPLYVLTSEPHPSCCCFSPHKASLVFAGTDDGSVVLWDLREPVSMHMCDQMTTYTWTPRVPTFTTAGISSSNHSVPICCITPLSVLTGHSRSSDESSVAEDGQGLSFQIASLDHSGKLNIWVIVEVSNPNPSGSESDLGLSPGGRVKLVRSASILAASFLPCSPVASGRDILFTKMAFHPRDVNHCYIGCDEGMVLHTIRYGKRSIPSQYASELGDVTKVTSISFSPWQPDHFLVGCLDGTIRLHHTRKERPLLCWTRSTNGVAVEWLQWSNHRPSVFLVLDHMSRLWVWDLLSFDSGPTMESDVCGGMSGNKSTVTCCALSHNTTSWKARLVMSCSDGSSEVHYLNQFLSEAQENEEQRFNDMLNSIIH